MLERLQYFCEEMMVKRFLAVYTGSAATRAAWEKLSETDRQARQAQGMAAWQSWAENNVASIVEGGGPLGRTKQVSKSGVTDTRNNLAAYTVVQAESQAAAAALFVNHPHFMLFPGEGVEVMEVLAIPQG